MTEQPAFYRKKPIPVEARQLLGSEDGEAAREIARWCGGWLGSTFREPKLLVPTLEGELMARVGDWIVKGPRGEFWPVKGDIFAETYESADAEPADQAVPRVIDLYERWVKAGPPPLGVSVARWWDTRLIELRDAIRPAAGAQQDADPVVEPHCAGFPTACPNPVTVPPAPPHHDGGIRCGCYDEVQQP